METTEEKINKMVCDRLQEHQSKMGYNEGINIEYFATDCATEQDRIAREEERKKCIDEVCEFMYNFHLPNGVAPLYDYVGNVRKAMEGGGYGND